MNRDRLSLILQLLTLGAILVLIFLVWNSSNTSYRFDSDRSGRGERLVPDN
jgi:hypothetical protein